MSPRFPFGGQLAERVVHRVADLADEVGALLQVVTDQRQLAAEAGGVERLLDQVQERVETVEAAEVDDVRRDRVRERRSGPGTRGGRGR